MKIPLIRKFCYFILIHYKEHFLTFPPKKCCYKYGSGVKRIKTEVRTCCIYVRTYMYTLEWSPYLTCPRMNSPSSLLSQTAGDFRWNRTHTQEGLAVFINTSGECNWQSVHWNISQTSNTAPLPCYQGPGTAGGAWPIYLALPSIFLKKSIG